MVSRVVTLQIILLLTAVCCFSGCASRMNEQKTCTTIKIPEPTPHPENVSGNSNHAVGSLWTTESVGSVLLNDHKARRINDIVTVKILENTSATNKASTNGKKTSERSAGIASLFGLEKEAENVVTRNFNPASLIKTSTENSFEGSGTTTRSGKIIATITAVVKHVYPNGNMFIEGKREIIVNYEKQMIFISGIIRQKDISVDNTVLSNAIAEMQVHYSGDGIVSQNQREGWLARLLGIIWPF